MVQHRGVPQALKRLELVSRRELELETDSDFGDRFNMNDILDVQFETRRNDNSFDCRHRYIYASGRLSLWSNWRTVGSENSIDQITVTKITDSHSGSTFDLMEQKIEVPVEDDEIAPSTRLNKIAQYFGESSYEVYQVESRVNDKWLPTSITIERRDDGAVRCACDTGDLSDD